MIKIPTGCFRYFYPKPTLLIMLKILPRFCCLFILALCSFNPLSSDAQVHLGVKKINLFADISYSNPEKELKNSYSLGDLMKFYVGVEVPIFTLGYSKKSTLCLSLAPILDHEKANFTREDYSTDGMDAKMTAYGLRLRPLANMAIYCPTGNVVDGHFVTETTHKVVGTDEFGNSNYSEYTTTESLPIWSEEGAKLLVTMFLSGLYFDYGRAGLVFIEPPSADVKRHGTLYAYGCSPSLAVGRKLTFYVDLGIRHYRWTNSLDTQSGIKSWHIGFGFGFNIK